MRTILRKLNRLSLLALAQVKPSTSTGGLRVVDHVMPSELFLENMTFTSYVKEQYQMQLKWSGVKKTKLYNASPLGRHAKRLMVQK